MILEFPTFQTEIIDPAVKGTLNILRSCAKVPSVKRVVITSSMATVIYNGTPLSPDVEVDETWFSDPVICENLKVCELVPKLLLSLQDVSVVQCLLNSNKLLLIPLFLSLFSPSFLVCLLFGHMFICLRVCK